MIARALLILFAVTLVLGTTAQAMPRPFETADVMMAGDADMSADCAMAMSDSGGEPCKGTASHCMDLMGCSLTAMVVSLSFLPAQVFWSDVTYPTAGLSLDCLSVKPDLTPPILSA